MKGLFAVVDRRCVMVYIAELAVRLLKHAGCLICSEIFLENDLPINTIPTLKIVH